MNDDTDDNSKVRHPSSLERDARTRRALESGLLVVIEGLDGCGKTVQARALVSHLESRGRPAHLTREPSDGPIGLLIREFLAGRHTLPDRGSDPATLACLFAADRADHCRREVQPRMSAGEVVVSDRWYLTSLAYQGSPHGSRWSAPVTQEWVREVNRGAVRPDLTIFLRVDPEVAAKRLALRGRTREIFEDLPAQRRFAAGYDRAIDLVRSLGERVEVLDGGVPAEDVGRQVQALVDDLTDDAASRLSRSEAWQIVATMVDECDPWVQTTVGNVSARLPDRAGPSDPDPAAGSGPPAGHQYRTSGCPHGLTFVPSAAARMTVAEVRRFYPRLDGECPLGCGFCGVAYASTPHYLAGDW